MSPNILFIITDQQRADHNGFIKQTRPRFYHQDQTSAGVLQNGACSGAVLRAEQDCQAAAQTASLIAEIDTPDTGTRPVSLGRPARR